MEASTSIKQMLAGNRIFVPTYQRAYSWDTEFEISKMPKQVNVFLSDLEDYNKSSTKSYYYFGHFLFEEKPDKKFGVIDGQQRLTTIVIFLSALFKQLSSIRKLTEIEQEIFEDIIKRNSTYRFETVDYDKQLFKDYVIDQTKKDKNGLETASAKRIVNAFDFFTSQLENKDETFLLRMLNTVQNATCTTHPVKDESEAIQMFIFQNNRGKELSRFEVITAYLMHQIYIQSADNNRANNDIAEIQSVISKTYRYIEAVEGYFTENELLDNYCNLFFNIGGNIEAIKEKLNKEENKTQWIKLFFENFIEVTHSAKSIVSNINQSDITNLFFVGNEANWKIVLLSIFYKGDVTGGTFKKILKLLKVLCFKLKLGDYRTDYLPHYSKQYFNPNLAYNIDNLYQDIKNATETGFKWYWNDGDRFKNIITNYFDYEKWHYNLITIKFVLWQYENSLRLKNRSGALLDKDLYDSYTIEHIKPQNPIDEEYSEDFKKNFLQLAGNLALLTQSQNSMFGNKSFDKKRELFQDTALSSYTEIREKIVWTETEISERHKRISDFAKQYFDTTNI